MDYSLSSLGVLADTICKALLHSLGRRGTKLSPHSAAKMFNGRAKLVDQRVNILTKCCNDRYLLCLRSFGMIEYDHDSMVDLSRTLCISHEIGLLWDVEHIIPCEECYDPLAGDE